MIAALLAAAVVQSSIVHTEATCENSRALHQMCAAHEDADSDITFSHNTLYTPDSVTIVDPGISAVAPRVLAPLGWPNAISVTYCTFGLDLARMGVSCRMVYGDARLRKNVKVWIPCQKIDARTFYCGRLPRAR